jgi:hypothetical protein
MAIGSSIRRTRPLMRKATRTVSGRFAMDVQQPGSMTTQYVAAAVSRDGHEPERSILDVGDTDMARRGMRSRCERTS